MAGRGALCRGQKQGEHRAGAGVDAPPDEMVININFSACIHVVCVELADTAQGVSSEQRMAVRGGLPSIQRMALFLRGLQSFQLTLSHCG